MNINAGHLAAVYVGAGPPKGTGYHRYVFLLYKQPSTINVEHVVHIQLTGKGRGGFKVLFVCLVVCFLKTIHLDFILNWLLKFAKPYKHTHTHTPTHHSSTAHQH